jgi:DNA-binding winged helix-turn-helix (wHTH) protein
VCFWLTPTPAVHAMLVLTIKHRMLETLARHPGRMITHKQLMCEVWGPHMENVGAVRVYIANLRRKVEADPRLPRHIITELGAGYRLVAETITGTLAMPNRINSRPPGAPFSIAVERGIS